MSYSCVRELFVLDAMQIVCVVLLHLLWVVMVYLICLCVLLSYMIWVTRTSGTG